MLICHNNTLTATEKICKESSCGPCIVHVAVNVLMQELIYFNIIIIIITGNFYEAKKNNYEAKKNSLLKDLNALV